MTKNPFYNALFAISYIVILVTGINYGTQYLHDAEESIFIPMSMLALLVLSVALMGYLFFYEPLLYILEGKREKGVTLFLQTVGLFAIGTLAVIAVAVWIGLAFS